MSVFLSFNGAVSSYYLSFPGRVYGGGVKKMLCILGCIVFTLFLLNSSFFYFC